MLEICAQDQTSRSIGGLFGGAREHAFRGIRMTEQETDLKVGHYESAWI